jgi:citrate lyase subunit beta/citryl-CoA lyase
MGELDMSDLPSIRTALFVPGNRTELVEKALNSGADTVIIDLEDAVPLTLKEEARCRVHDKLLEHKGRNIIVRTNGIGSDLLEKDLDEVIVKGLLCIMVPKVETAHDIRTIDSLFLRVEEKREIEAGTIKAIPLIESAIGVQNIFDIVSVKTDSHRLYTVAFGAADYTLDMGIELTRDANELAYPRSRITIACRAAGIKPPLDSPFMIDLKDEQGLRADAFKAKRLGFQGKLCIHPNQIGPCNEIFSPSKDEILFARKVIQAFEEAETKGMGAIQLEGKFIDFPIVEKARRVMKLAVDLGIE